SSCAPARCPCIRLRPRNSRTRAVPCVRLPGKREKCQYHITEFVSHPEKSRILSMSVAHGLAVHGISVMRADSGEDMFGKSNGQLLDEQLGVTPSRETNPAGTAAQPQPSSVAQPRATPQAPGTGDKISTLGPGMAIVGKIDCQGTLHIFGRIEGEL